jgi:hypothetical protein
VMGLAAAASEQPAPLAVVQFDWTLAARSPGGTPTLIEGDATLRTGDQLKLYLSPVTQTFVYVLFENARGDMQLLFPRALSLFDFGYGRGQSYYAPPDDAWMTLTPPAGENRIHVIASAARLTRLESLLSQHAAAPPPQQAVLARQLADEVRDLKRQHRDFQSTSARPLPMGGAVRGRLSQSDLRPLAREIRADKFYAWTYTITHR